jgi:hypothetical protein
MPLQTSEHAGARDSHSEINQPSRETLKSKSGLVNSDFATIAKSWLGTPWMPNGKVKGAGVSCQMLVACIYKEAGLLPESVTIPEGPMDWSVANKNSIIEPFIDGPLAEYFEPVSRWPEAMDLITFKIGGCGHHLGAVVSDQPTEFVHILMHRAVVVSRLDDASWMKRISRVWRPRCG